MKVLVQCRYWFIMTVIVMKELRLTIAGRLWLDTHTVQQIAISPGLCVIWLAQKNKNIPTPIMTVGMIASDSTMSRSSSLSHHIGEDFDEESRNIVYIQRQIGPSYRGICLYIIVSGWIVRKYQDRRYLKIVHSGEGA